jgi:hypothetical protein
MIYAPAPDTLQIHSPAGLFTYHLTSFRPGRKPSVKPVLGCVGIDYGTTPTIIMKSGKTHIPGVVNTPDCVEPRAEAHIHIAMPFSSGITAFQTPNLSPTWGR